MPPDDEPAYVERIIKQLDAVHEHAAEQSRLFELGISACRRTVNEVEKLREEVRAAFRAEDSRMSRIEARLQSIEDDRASA